MSDGYENAAHYRYVDSLSLASKLRRLVWQVVWMFLFRTTPSWCLDAWRCALLRLFGATIGRGCRIASNCQIWAPWNLTLGHYVCLAGEVDCYCVSPISIGNKVTVSQRSFLCTASHDIRTLQRPLIHQPIRIGEHAWVCAEAFVGPGITIGEGAVVAARAVAVRDVPEWTIVAGNPARVIRRREIAEERPSD